jgi:hypothetical protein
MKAMCALAAAAVIAIGCSDTGRSPTSPAHTGATGATELLGGGLHLLHCSQQSYDSVTQVVDSSGGTIYVGSHVFTIPAGAIDSAVTITAVTPSVNRREVQFQPEGLTFNTPASLTMSYDGCGVLGLLLPRKIGYTDAGLNLLELISSLDNPLAKQVTGQVEHFSGYVVWY